MNEEIGVVHLVRAQNGIEPFNEFLKSYRENSGEIKHQLLLALKGFEHQDDKTEYLSKLGSLKYTAIVVPNIGFDISAYFFVAKFYASQYRYFCFLNSYSVIQDKGWLRKLYEHISCDGVGLVGATGSWERHKNYKIFWRDTLEVACNHYALYKGKVFWKRIALATIAVWNYQQTIMSFDTFPNYHLRTNCFMISSEIMNSLKCPNLETKMDAYKFESGKKGMTRQVLRLKKNVLVVGKDGIGYEKKAWNKSKTFWQSEQENLLVADNQTYKYQFGSLDTRRYLSCMAWRIECENSNNGVSE